MNPAATIFMWVGIHVVLLGYIAYLWWSTRSTEKPGDGAREVEMWKSIYKSTFPNLPAGEAVNTGYVCARCGCEDSIASTDLKWCTGCGEGVTTFCRGKADKCPMFPFKGEAA